MLGQRFDVVRRLGEGGMGIVFEALDRESGAHVALKKLRHVSPGGLARFKREFRAVQDLHHPNLVTLGELISEGEDWLFTMELIPGCNFLTYVRGTDAAWRRGDYLASLPTIGSSSDFSRDDGAPRRAPAPRPSPPLPPPLDERRLRLALHQLAEGLIALHAAGLVHRDIKPSNIRVTPDERVVLLDFGLVAELGGDHRSMAHDILGTPSYMAPEQATGIAIGAEADWYSVGVVLYEALTGVLPFEGAQLDVLLQKQRASPPSPSARVAHVPHDLDDLCTRLLQIDPLARPRAAEVLRVSSVSERRERPESSTPSSSAIDAPFVGRRIELDELRRAFDEVQAGRSISVVIRGESGVGKSCLVRRFLEDLRNQKPDALALSGRCYERESVPCKGFDDVVDALARMLRRVPQEECLALLPTRLGALVQVFPVFRRVPSIDRLARGAVTSMDPVEHRGRAFAAMRELLTRLSDRRPLVIVIDDLQWADDDSRLLLTHLLSPPEAPSLLLLATVRTNPADPVLSARADAIASSLPNDLRTIAVPPLSDSEGFALAELLLERTTQAEIPIDARAIAQEARGHPLFIDALVRHGATRKKGTGGHVRLDEAILARVEALDPVARRGMDLLAVAGGPISQDLLHKAVGAEGSDLGNRIALLRVAHLVQTGGSRGRDTIDASHERIRAAVLTRLEPEARASLHRRLALAFEAAGRTENAEALVTHWRGAGQLAEAARAAAVTGDQAAATLAFDRAARCYELALSLSAHDADEERLLRTKLGDAWSNAGHGASAARAFQAAAEGAPAAEALELRRRAAEQLLRAGHFDEGVDALGVLLRAVGMRMPRSPLTAIVVYVFLRVVVRLRGIRFKVRDVSQVPAKDLLRIEICWTAGVGLFGDTLRAGVFNAKEVLLALRAGEPARIARAFAVEMVARARRGSRAWRTTQAMMARTMDLARRAQRPEALGFGSSASGVAYYLSGRFRQGLELLDRGQRILRDQCAGHVWEIATTQIYALGCLAQLGDLKELARRRPQYLREAADRGDLYATVNLGVGFSNLGLLAEDQPDECIAQVERAVRTWTTRGFHLPHYYALVARANVALYVGDAAGAQVGLAQAWPALRRSLLLTGVQAIRIVSHWTRGRCALAAAGARVGDVPALLATAERDARVLARQSAEWAEPLALLLRAGIARSKTHADDPRARRLLAAAAKGFDAVDMALHAAATRRALGELVGGEEGRSLIETSDAWMKEQTVRSPARMTGMLVPGIALREGGS